jgi:hypothetical protein
MRSISVGCSFVGSSVLFLGSVLAVCGCNYEGDHHDGPETGATITDESTIAIISCQLIEQREEEEGEEPTGACSPEQPSCDLGRECCCGRCRPNMVCECLEGQWSCYHTDFCAFPSCIEAGVDSTNPDSGVLVDGG